MQVMQELGLIGLRIQRMPSEPGLEFGIPSQYSYMTVRFQCCIVLLIFGLNYQGAFGHSLMLISIIFHAFVAMLILF